MSVDYYTSDTHYFHKNVILYCTRPFRTLDGQPDVDAMHETMIRLWNDRVGPDDHVFHLGDFAFGAKDKQTDILKRLNGHKWLVRGNHDGSVQRMRQIGFEEVFEDGFHTDAATGLVVYLRHKPRPGWLEELPWAEACAAHLHGHVHELYARRDNMINVGVDASWFMPLTLEELLQRPHHIEEYSPWIAANYIPCDSYGCKNLKPKDAFFCHSCAYDYVQDPDSLK